MLVRNGSDKDFFYYIDNNISILFTINVKYVFYSLKRRFCKFIICLTRHLILDFFSGM